MTTGRCNDPDCTCRSPELQWFTNQVLRRDAAKTDYIVLPLVAGVLARCLLAWEPDPNFPETPGDGSDSRDRARAVMDLATRPAAEGDGSWDADVDAYGAIADLVFCSWPAVLSWGSLSYHHTLLGIDLDLRSNEAYVATVQLLGSTTPPSLTESVILAMLASMQVEARKKQEIPLLGKAGRRLRVVLADRLRRDGLVRWPAILSAAVNDWTVPTLERLAQHLAAAGDAAIHYVMKMTEAAAAEREQDAPDGTGGAAAQTNAPPPPVKAPDAAVKPRDDGEIEAAESLLEDAAAEIQHWRSQRQRVQTERDAFATRDARSRSRIESLERELKSAVEGRDRLERELRDVRAERDQLAERIAADEAVVDDAPPPATDTFAGRRVLFFTGMEAADTRAALAQGFWDLGAAQVDCYWTDKSRGPDVFPADAIVAVDVSHMSHAAWGTIQDRVRASGAWCYWGKHGAATMSRATAAAWRTHLALPSDTGG